MRTSALGMSPAEIAHASSVITAASAASGDKKYVSGTMRATAIVADSPGIEPKSVPYIAARAMTARTVGSKTWEKAWASVCPMSPAEEAARQRNAQEHGEHVVDR